MDNRKLTTGDIARYCGVDFRTVIRWIDKGKLPGFRLPERGDRRVLASDFLAFLKEHNMPIPKDLNDSERRILIVDDESPVARSIERILLLHGYETRVASNGFSAGALLETFRPSLMTLDLAMPGLGGTDVIKFTRSPEVPFDTKILVISAMPPEELEEARALGADDVLAKPFNMADLIHKIETLTGARAQDGG